MKWDVNENKSPEESNWIQNERSNKMCVVCMHDVLLFEVMNFRQH